ARSEAAVEAKKVMDAAKLSIEQSRKEAELQFRNEVSKFSVEIAEKMLRHQMQSDKAQTELVNQLLDEIEKN
ncbi:MAG: ATP synthase F0 subunit B, partial [Muribaculaceae bacterium]|nr:ATP synthase F0 subunit B [Muribaculaceae bacterium]